MFIVYSFSRTSNEKTTRISIFFNLTLEIVFKGEPHCNLFINPTTSGCMLLQKYNMVE